MGRFGHFLLGFVAGSVAFHYLIADSRGGFWLVALVAVCLAAELLYAARALDKRLVTRLFGARQPRQE
jgi:hypothetical protein